MNQFVSDKPLWVVCWQPSGQFLKLIVNLVKLQQIKIVSSDFGETTSPSQFPVLLFQEPTVKTNIEMFQEFKTLRLWNSARPVSRERMLLILLIQSQTWKEFSANKICTDETTPWLSPRTSTVLLNMYLWCDVMWCGLTVTIHRKGFNLLKASKGS